LPSQEVERISLPAPSSSGVAFALPISDGRTVVHTVVLGRNQLMMKSRGSELTPFLSTAEESNGPVALVGSDLAFIAGSGSARSIALASVADGRIIKRIISIGSDAVPSLAGSTDGKQLYFARAGGIWSMEISGGEPRRLSDGDAVAVDPSDASIVILLNSAGGVRLERIRRSGKAEKIPLSESVHLVAELAPNAIDRRGRIAVRHVVPDSWFWRAAILDPSTGTVEALAGGREADMIRPGWDADGRLVTSAYFVRSDIWRFSPHPSN